MIWRNLTTAVSLHSIFQGEFPLTAEFRNEPRNAVPSYEKWKELQPVGKGQAVDLQTNMLRFAPENHEFANQYAKENPELLMLSTWRAQAGLPKNVPLSNFNRIDPLESSEIEFPGHWVVGQSTTLSSDLSEKSTTMKVFSSDPMKVGPALIVETERGKPEKRIWTRFEYVLIKKVEKKGSGADLIVERAFNGSPSSRSFPAMHTQVASMPWDSRSKHDYINWYFNFAKDCPTDENGRTAVDILVQAMIGPLKEGRSLDHIGGIDLASGPLSIDLGRADYNGDGFEESSDIYWDGVRAFYQRLRNGLGPHRVLTANMDWNYVEYINGANQEGLVRPNDPWREVSRTVNEMLFWKRLSPLPFVTIAFVQYLTKEEDLIRVQMHRLLNAYSVCLGMAADIKFGDGILELTRAELFKGEENEAHWLGKALGPPKRPATLKPNLLLGDRRSTGQWDDIKPNLSTLRGVLIEDGDELVLRASGRRVGFMTLNLFFQLEQTTDFVVYLEAMSGDGSNEVKTREVMDPRVSVRYETGPIRARISNQEYAPVSFYVRGAKAGDVKMDFRFEDWDDVRFRSISVHAAPDTLACEFEKGVVLVNPSLEDESLDLMKIFPGRSGYKRLKVAEPTGSIETKYMPQFRQAMEMNNGKYIGNPRSLIVPERNAIFLTANEVNSTYQLPPETNPPTIDPRSSSPSEVPTTTPSSQPTLVLTSTPSVTPTATPSDSPTINETMSPSKTFSSTPSLQPTLVVTASPSIVPSAIPSSVSRTNYPSWLPTIDESSVSELPSAIPTMIAPTKPPTKAASNENNLIVIYCVDKEGRFRNHRRNRRTCSWLKSSSYLDENCGAPATPLGEACPATCWQYNGCMSS